MRCAPTACSRGALRVLTTGVLVAFFVVGVPFFDEPRSIWPVLLFLLIVGSHAVPWTALTVRRLHDMDLTGRWALLGLRGGRRVPLDREECDP